MSKLSPRNDNLLQAPRSVVLRETFNVPKKIMDIFQATESGVAHIKPAKLYKFYLLFLCQSLSELSYSFAPHALRGSNLKSPLKKQCSSNQGRTRRKRQSPPMYTSINRSIHCHCRTRSTLIRALRRFLHGSAKVKEGPRATNINDLIEGHRPRKHQVFPWYEAKQGKG